MVNQRIINDDAKYRCASYDGEILFNNYIKIDNSNLSAKVIDLVQSNYKSITINDKQIEAGTSKQYLIDDL